MTHGSGIGVGAKAAPPGVFETIAGAASDLLVRPWPLLIPLALDLWLWAGPRLSPAAVAEPIRRWLREATPASPAGGTSGTDLATGVGLTDLIDLAGAFVPSLLAMLDRAALPVPWPQATATPDAGAVVALALLVVALGVAGMMALLTVVARVGTGEPVAPGLPRAIAAATLRYLAFLALALLVMVTLAVPAGIGLAVTQVALGVPLDALLAALILPVAFVVSLFLAFTGEAVVLDRAGPLRAPALSAKLVWRHPWPALGLLVVVQTFAFGLPLVVGPLLTSVPGLLVAVLAAAFVATVLALAKLRFFAARRGQPATGRGRAAGRQPPGPR